MNFDRINASTSGVSFARPGPLRRCIALPGRPRLASSVATSCRLLACISGVSSLLFRLRFRTFEHASSQRVRLSPAAHRSKRDAKMLLFLLCLDFPPGNTVKHTLQNIQSSNQEIRERLRAAVSLSVPIKSWSSVQLWSKTIETHLLNCCSAFGNNPSPIMSRVCKGAKQISSSDGIWSSSAKSTSFAESRVWVPCTLGFGIMRCLLAMHVRCTPLLHLRLTVQPQSEQGTKLC